MIYFVVPGVQIHTFGPFLDRTDPEVRDRVKIITLEQAVRRSGLPIGTYVFSGLCVGSDAARKVACEFSQQLKAGDSSIRLLNDPEGVLWRHELLRALHDAGINGYRAYRYHELSNQTPRFPVFVRSERMHTGNLTPILNDREELRKAFAMLKRMGHSVEKLLTVEYVHAPGEDGLFRKYTAYRVGDELIPRYVTWSSKWLVKQHAKDLRPDDPSIPRLVQEELDYARNGPWRDVLWKAFTLSNIQYGRVDFTVMNGLLQIWEINTAPYLSPKDLIRPQEDWLNRLREPTKDLFYARFFPALFSLDASYPDGTVPIALDEHLVNQVLKEEARARRFLWLQPLKRLAKRWPRKGPLRVVRVLFRPFMRWVTRLS
ncbi:MAG TPA: hypothetical protein VMO47_15610 [Rhodothermales bacterium]|nr:hypothetical protein [Rhodothermales bacterium]